MGKTNTTRFPSLFQRQYLRVRDSMMPSRDLKIALSYSRYVDLTLTIYQKNVNLIHFIYRTQRFFQLVYI